MEYCFNRHPLTSDNTFVSDSRRRCKECRKLAQEKFRSSFNKAIRLPVPTSNQLVEDIKLLCWSDIGRKYGVTDAAARKWARKSGLLPAYKPPNKNVTKHPCASCGEPTWPRRKKYCDSLVCRKLRPKTHLGKPSLAWEELRSYGGRRNRLFKEREHVCALCKRTEWEDKPIPLVADHINGNADDNSKENMRLICPNCNAQTPTFTGKNKGKGSKKRVIQNYKYLLKAIEANDPEIGQVSKQTLEGVKLKIEECSKLHPPRVADTVTLVCDRCGTPFDRLLRVIRRNKGNKTYCNRECYLASDRAGLILGRIPRDRRHGTDSCYTYGKCRCLLCTDAHRQAHKRYRERKKTKVQRGLAQAEEHWIRDPEVEIS